MKNKFLTIFTALLCLLCLPLCACKKEISSGPQNNLSRETTTLVLYFSRTGKVSAIAKEIAANLNADIYRIEPQTAYPEDDESANEIARDEFNSDERPTIKNKLSDLSKYDVVFIGFPVWLENLPNIILSMTENNSSFEGKTIVPFCVHNGSGADRALVSLRTALSDNRFLSSFSALESEAESEQTKTDLGNWLEQIL